MRSDCSFEVVHYSQVYKYVQLIGQESLKMGQRRQSAVAVQGFKGLKPQAEDGRWLGSNMSSKDSQVFNEIN